MGEDHCVVEDVKEGRDRDSVDLLTAFEPAGGCAVAWAVTWLGPPNTKSRCTY